MIDLEKIVLYALLVPMGPDEETHPNDPACIWGLPMCFWGEPGIGKSSRIRTACRALNLPMEPVYPATRQPEDFSGVPVVNLQGELSIECILGAVRTLMLFQEGVLFIDEVSCARPAVQAALLSVVLDRRIGDTILPPGIRILLAANPESMAAGGWELAAPMSNRMAHYVVPPNSAHRWVRWALRVDRLKLPPLHDGMDIVRQSWDGCLARAKALICGFIQRTGDDMLHSIPPEGHEDRGRAWRSERMWEAAWRSVAVCLALNPHTRMVTKDSTGKMVVDSMAHFFVEACVGSAAATEWASWLATADLPEPEEVLTKGWKPDKKRIDRTYAVIASVAGYVISQQDRLDRNKMAVPAWKLLHDTCNIGLGDIAMVGAEILSRESLSIDCNDPAVVAAAKPVVLHLSKSGIDEYAVKAASA